jgi:hypothetical protein
MPVATGNGRAEARALSRLAQLRIGRREYRKVRWPGTDAWLLMRIVSASEAQECRAAAEHRLVNELSMTIGPHNYDVLEEECLTQLLFRACRDAEDPERLTFAVDVADFRDNVDIDQRASLFVQYRDFQVERDPDPVTMGPALIADIEALIKKKDEPRLNDYGSRVLVSYMLTTGNPPSTSPNGNSGSTD